jgi:polyisoprenyl-phosphate glycosyltransferase
MQHDTTDSGTACRVSLVVPCYNEAEGLPEFLAAVCDAADGMPDREFEFLFVNDGSTDATEAMLLSHQKHDPRTRIVSLSRNYGHQRAITAGLDHCTGGYIIVIDADMQDPPELIPAIIKKLDAGADIVHMVRTSRAADSFCKRATAKLFYMVMRRWVLPELPENAADFKGFTRRVCEELRRYPERVRFLRGIIATLGFRQEEIGYTRPVRHAGRSSFPFRNVVRFARDAVVSNTILPLRTGLYAGLLAWGALLLYGCGMLAGLLTGSRPEEPLLHFILGLLLAFSGLILILLGVIGEYLKCLILETKQRPLYIVREVLSADAPDPEA